MPTAFDVRLVAYTPLGARGAVIPDLGFDVVSSQDGPTLQARVSEVVAGTLPDLLEVAVEYWDGTAWVEGIDSRFLVNTTDGDDRDPSGVRALTGANLWWWLLGKNRLAGVPAYSQSGMQVSAAQGAHNGTTAGDTVTIPGHGFSNGDTVLLDQFPFGFLPLDLDIPYYVADATLNTFRLRGSRNGGAIQLDSWSGVGFRRTLDIIIAPGTQFREHDKIVFTNVGNSPTLETDRAYYVVQLTPYPGGAMFKVSTEVGGDPLDLIGEGLVANFTVDAYRDTDGNRQFSAVTPGTLLKTVVDEAKARGWGPAIAYDFTTTADSGGAAWASLVTMQFDPGTSAAVVLRTLVDQGMADFTTTGRTLHLHNADHGVDRAIGGAPTRVGAGASSLGAKTDLNALLTALTVVGEGALQLDLPNPGAPTALGRLEGYQSLSGVMDAASATVLAHQTLLEGADARRQYSVTEPAAAAAALPWINYQRGDWVQARIDDSWARFRVVGVQVSKDSKGLIDVTPVLNDRFTDLLVRLARRQTASSGGITVGGSGAGGRGTGAHDTRKPNAPVGLVVDSRAVWGADGTPAVSLLSTWSRVTQATDSTAIDIAGYELWLRTRNSAEARQVAAVSGTSATYGPVTAGGTYYVKVRARSSADQWGPYSDEVEIVTAVPIEPLKPPTALTLSQTLGVVSAAWDGKLEGGTTPPAQFAYVYVMMSTAEVGTYVPVGTNMGRAGRVTVPDVTTGTTYWFKAYAVDRLGIVSQPSPAVSIMVSAIDLNAFDPTFNDTMTELRGKNRILIGPLSPPSPDPDAATRQVNDVWWKRNDQAEIIGQWMWDGDSWEPQTLASQLIASLDVGKLTAGAASIQAAVVDKLVAAVLTAGSIQSQHINVGAKVPSGTPTNRIAAPVTDVAYWGLVKTGVIPAAVPWTSLATPTTNGIRFVSGATAAAGVTPVLPAPMSGKLAMNAVGIGAVKVTVRWWAGSTALDYQSLAADGTYTAPAGATGYDVYLETWDNTSSGTVSALSVFEVIGTQTGQQRAELSPAGLRLTSDDGSGVIDLTTNSNQFLSIQKDTGVGFEAQATIDSDGNSGFRNVRVNEDIYTRGTPLLGAFETQIRNGKADTGPLMSRLSRGVILAGFYSNPAAVTYVNDFKAIASSQFVTSADREYRLNIDDNLYWFNNGTAGLIHAEVLISENPINVNATTGYTVIKNSRIGAGQYALNPFRMNRVMTSGTVLGNGQFKAGTTYMLLRFRLEPGANLFLAYGDTDVPNTLLIEDIGPALGFNINYTDTGVGAGPSTPQVPSSPPAMIQTATFASTWSRSFHDSGATIVSGSTQFTNGSYLYQGFGASPMGSQFGFGALGLSGRTILGARLFMQNLYTYSSGGMTVRLGTHGNASAPGSISGLGANLSNVPWGRGEGKWIDLGSWAYAGLAAGTIRGFQLGVSGVAAGEYGYFAGQGDPRPVLQVTYQ